jgi:capsid protein
MGLRSFVNSLFGKRKAKAATSGGFNRRIAARYDAAQTTDEFKNYWANADSFDADSAHSPEIRHALMWRSRYEAANNGFADGIGQTYSTDLIARAPTLRMQTGSDGFNRMIENQWYLWTKEIQWRRKLWCMAHAKHVDGEAFGVIRRNKRIKHPVKLDLVLYEADQIQTPYLQYGDEGYIDGIKFDEFGNPLWYDLLRNHPGNSYVTDMQLDAERIPADFMLHWYKMRRPGQHRGVPECASTLQVGASSRRMREATVSAVENAARLGAILLHSGLAPDETEQPEPLSSTNTKLGMMTVLPAGWDANQMKAEHPNATYQEFLRSQISEMARPKSMPRNKAQCDSSDYNFASGRLDHISYYDYLDVDRDDCNEQVCDKLFDRWFDAAILAFGWLGGNPETVGASARSHVWDWSTHKVADEKSQAIANQTKLASGQILLPQLYAQSGLDFDDEVERAAQQLRIPADELRKRLLDASLPVKPEAAPQEPAEDEDEQPQPDEQRRSATAVSTNRVNGYMNGHAHTT